MNAGSHHTLIPHYNGQQVASPSSVVVCLSEKLSAPKRQSPVQHSFKFSIIKNTKELHHQYSRNNLQLYRQWRESQEVHGDLRHQHSNQIWIYSNCLNNANQITLQLYNIYTSSGNIYFHKAYNDSMEWWHCNNFLQASFPDWHGNKLLIRLWS